jgi:hypothetical protein
MDAFPKHHHLRNLPAEANFCPYRYTRILFSFLVMQSRRFWRLKSRVYMYVNKVKLLKRWLKKIIVVRNYDILRIYKLWVKLEGSDTEGRDTLSNIRNSPYQFIKDGMLRRNPDLFATLDHAKLNTVIWLYCNTRRAFRNMFRTWFKTTKVSTPFKTLHLPPKFTFTSITIQELQDAKKDYLDSENLSDSVSLAAAFIFPRSNSSLILIPSSTGLGHRMGSSAPPTSRNHTLTANVDPVTPSKLKRLQALDRKIKLPPLIAKTVEKELARRKQDEFFPERPVAKPLETPPLSENGSQISTASSLGSCTMNNLSFPITVQRTLRGRSLRPLTPHPATGGCRPQTLSLDSRSRLPSHTPITGDTDCFTINHGGPSNNPNRNTMCCLPLSKRKLQQLGVPVYMEKISFPRSLPSSPVLNALKDPEPAMLLRRRDFSLNK